MAGTKIPESVLVVVHAPGLRVLLLERADHPGFWQSVTGSRDRPDEPLVETCRREVLEETGIDAAPATFEDWGVRNRYEIYPQWRHRYPEGTTHNVEHVFGLALPGEPTVLLSPREHLRSRWMPWEEAAGMCFSMTNVEAIRMLPARAGTR